MPRFLKAISKKTGSAPGTIVHIGEKTAENVVITLIEYDADSASRKTVSTTKELESLPLESNKNRWINVDGLHDIAIIEVIGARFGLHPLTLEDIVNTGHRPKAEEFDTYFLVIMKMLGDPPPGEAIPSEQLSLIIRDRLLITFQEKTGDQFGPVRERIQNGKGRIRRTGIDYLAYALMDTVVDHYYHILEEIGDDIERLEDALLENPAGDQLQRIHELKRESVYMRKQVWPLRDIIAGLTRDESEFISEETRLFIRDIQDHTVQVVEIIDSYREMLTALLDLYMSGISNKMNEVMKVLTIIATIFIPVTFVAGIYGMNFKHIPELEWPWGYGFAWAVMAAIVLLMVGYFKKKKWW